MVDTAAHGEETIQVDTADIIIIGSRVVMEELLAHYCIHVAAS